MATPQGASSQFSLPLLDGTSNCSTYTTDLVRRHGTHIDFDLKLRMQPLAVQNKEKSIVAAILKMNETHQRLKAFFTKHSVLKTELLKRELRYDVTANDVLNHSVLRECKQACDSFLNTLSQCSMSTLMISEIGFSSDPIVLITKLLSNDNCITVVNHDGQNERALWALTLHAYRLRLFLMAPTMLQMEQGEGPSTQAMEDQLITDEKSVKAQNTEITKQVDDSTNVATDDDNMLQLVSTTTDLVSLEQISQRFIRVLNTEPLLFNVSDVPDQIIFEMDIPNGLYRYMDTTTATALRNFTTIKTDVEIIVKLNANQAQCGQYIVSHYPCWNQLQSNNIDNVYRMLQRDHAIIDLATSNDVKYTIRYENLRPFLPVQTNELGETIGGSYARFFIRCLSPLRIADTGNPRCPFQIIARLENVKMTGMRYPVPPDQTPAPTRVRTREEIDADLLASGIESNPGPVSILVQPYELQMETQRLDGALKSINKSVGAIPILGSIWKILGTVTGNAAVALGKILPVDQTRISEIESRLQYIGMINKDRPIDISHPSPLLPLPVHAYSYGRGPYSSKKLRLEPESTTPHLHAHKAIETTQSILDIARVPSYLTRFNVDTTMVQGDLLTELPVIPYDPRYKPNGTSLNGYIQIPTVAYCAGLYEYYSGSITYEFRPVKTPSHNFSMQVAMIPFNGDPGTTTDTQMQSCDWKTIDFRSAESSRYIVPWISTNPMRMWPYPDTGITSTINDQWTDSSYYLGINSGMKDPGKVIVRLVNELNPTPIVSPTIEVLVFVSAHENLRFLTPKNSSWTPAIPPVHYPFERNGAQFQNNNIPLLRNARPAPYRLEMETITPVQHGDELTPASEQRRQAFGPQIQTMEKHDNMYDVMRRFQHHLTLTGTQFANAQTILPYNPIATFPVTLYAHNPYVPNLGEVPSFTTHDLTQPPTSYREALVMCHRWGRGSMELVFHVLNDHPVEISYRPPVDAPSFVSGGITTTQQILLDVYDIPLYGPINPVGYQVEVIEPRLNPIQTLEVPFYNINNYIDVQAPLYERGLYRWTTDNYPRQDLASLTLGQVVIKQLVPSTQEDAFHIRVMSAFADDMQLYHFMGVPPIIYSPANSWVMTQHVSRTVRSRNEIEMELLASGIESNPGPTTFSSFLDGSSQLLSKAGSNTAALFSELKQIISTPKHLVSEVTALRKKGDSIIETIQNVLAAYTTGISVLEITSLTMNICSYFKNGGNWLQLISIFLSILHMTGVFSIDMLERFSKTCCTQVIEDQCSQTETLQAETNNNSLVVGVIASLIIETASCVYKSNTPFECNFDYVKKVVSKFFLNDFNYMRAGAICVFFTRFSNVISDLWQNVNKWIRGYSKLDILKDDPDFIRNFMIDYEFFMNEMNLQSISMMIRHRDRFWTTLISAYYLKNLMTCADNKGRNTAVLAACNEIIRRANDVNSFMAAPPVRYEPYVLWIYGPAGTGKSTMARNLSIDMAKQIGHKFNADPVYDRSPHSTFWNGYAGQPVVHLDDAGAVDEPALLSRNLSEFQAMKTTARMRLEMPRLEEKNAEFCSTIVTVCSNFPDFKSTMVKDTTAFARRRDMLVKAEFSQAALDYFATCRGKKTTGDLPAEMVKSKKHIVFSHYPDPTNVDKFERLNYDQMAARLMADHKRYHAAEIDKMFERYKKSLALSQNIQERVMDSQSLKIAVMAIILGSESAEVMSDTVKATILRLKQHCPQRFNDLPSHTQQLIESLKGSQLQVDLTASSVISGLATMSPFMNDNVRNKPENTFWNKLKSKFMPWNYGNPTFDENMITSTCYTCREEFGNAIRIGMICPNSTSVNQHWQCETCFKTERQVNRDAACGKCREKNLLIVTESMNNFRWYHKAAHMIRTASTLVMRPVLVTLDVAWQNAHWLYLASIVLINVAVIGGTIAVCREITRLDDATNDFINQVGAIPEKSALLNGDYVFSVDNVLYSRNDNGIFTSNELQVEDGSSQPWQSVEKKKGKGRGKTTPTVPALPIVPKASGSQDIPVLSLKDAANFDTIYPDFNKEVVTDPPKGDESDNHKDPLHKEEDIESNTSSSSSEHQFFDVFPTIDELDSEECSEVHNSFDIGQAMNRYRLSQILPSHDDSAYILLLSMNDDIKTLHLPMIQCKRDMCARNSHLRHFHSIYEKKIKKYVDSGQVLSLPKYMRPKQQENVIERTRFMRFIEHQKEILYSLKGSIVGWFEKIYEVICEQWKWVFSILSLIIAMYFGIKFFLNDDGDVEIGDELQTEHARQRQSHRVKTRTLTRTRMNVEQSSSLQASLSINSAPPPQVKAIMDLVSKQILSIQCGALKARGFVIGNNVAVFPRHSIHILCDAQRDGKAVQMTLPDGDTFILKDNLGLCIIKDEPNHEYVWVHHKRITGRDIRRHIFSAVTDDVTYPAFGYAYDVQDDKPRPISILEAVCGDEENRIPLRVMIEDKNYEYVSAFTRYLITNGLYGNGKCGSPLFDPSGKIIGMHIAGSHPAMATGFTALFFADEFEHDIFKTPEKPIELQMETPNLIHIGTYPRAPYHVSQSKIKPSVISSHAWDSLTEPCIQSKEDLRWNHEDTPLIAGARTIGAQTNPPDPSILVAAASAVADELLSKMPSLSAKIPISLQEAVTARSHQFVEKMDLNTSAGLPLIADNPGKSRKSDYVKIKVTHGKEYLEIDPAFERQYKQMYQQRKNGIPPRQPMWAHLKDERRKPAKARSYGGTRVFNVAPLELVLTSRRLLLPFMDAFHSNPVEHHHGIGLPPDSPVWTKLVESLRAKGPYLIQLDFSKFSDSLPWDFVYAAFGIMKEYYLRNGAMSADIELMFNTIEYELTRSLLVVGRDIYEIQNGVLQGHPITSVLNSLVNLIEQVYVWIKLTNEPGSRFFETCGIVVMGDDVVISVPHQCISKGYDGQAIASCFREMNIQVTDENKDPDNIQKFQFFDEFNFISRSFQLHPYRELYLAPCEISSVFDTPLWITKIDGPFCDATRENMLQSLMLMYGHGPVMYEMYRSVLQFLLPETSFVSWFDLDYTFMKAEGFRERSVVSSNLGVVAGTSRKKHELLGATVGRIGNQGDREKDVGNQYWNVDFLNNVMLDTQGTVAGRYRCNCRYKCEKELMLRIEQVEQRTGTPRKQFLPFTSQEEGTRILGARIDVLTRNPLRTRGYSSTIAFTLPSDLSDSSVGCTDSTRDRVQEMEPSANGCLARDQHGISIEEIETHGRALPFVYKDI